MFDISGLAGCYKSSTLSLYVVFMIVLGIAVVSCWREAWVFPSGLRCRAVASVVASAVVGDGSMGKPFLVAASAVAAMSW